MKNSEMKVTVQALSLQTRDNREESFDFRVMEISQSEEEIRNFERKNADTEINIKMSNAYIIGCLEKETGTN